MSARIANAIAEVYLADQVDNKNEANRRATEWLEERLAELRRNLQVAEEAVATYRRDKGLAGVCTAHARPLVPEVADRLQVLRLGRRIATFDADNTHVEELVGAMTGALDSKDAA